MPNKTMDFQVDLVPETTGTYNLGTSSKKWKLNGKTTGDAIEKGVDSSISSGSTSTDLPTSSAVAAFVEGKGYVTVNVVGDTLVFG